MKAVWKFPLKHPFESGGSQLVSLPQHADVLTVAERRGEFALWAAVPIVAGRPPDGVVSLRRVVIVPTGADISEQALTGCAFIGTIQTDRNVFHVWVEGEAI
jgi:hypothetical protein